MHDEIRVLPALTHAEQRTLRVLVGHMIPASDTFGVPGADDAAILADIIASLGREAAAVRAAIAEVDRLAGGNLADQGAAPQATAIASFRDSGSPLVSALVLATVRCYYRDDRVMRAIGMQPRPPFPLGFTLPEGNWSLLEPVRARGAIYRDVP